MEVNKILCVENPPFESNNLFINFNVRPNAYDWNSSYINIPCSINESYIFDFNPEIAYNGAVANVYLKSTPISLGSKFFKSVKLQVDSSEIIYTLYPNILNANLDLYTYNSDQLPLQEFLSGNKITKAPYNSDLSFSQFRELFNIGNIRSKNYVTNIRVQLKDILGDFCSVPRDFSKYSEVTITLELDELNFELGETNPQFNYNNSLICTTNDLTLQQLGVLNTSQQLNGTVNAGTETEFVFNGDAIPVEQLYFAEGDTIVINATNYTIDTVNPDANGNAISYTVDANINVGNNTIELTSTPVYKMIKVLNKSIDDLNNNGIKIGHAVAISIDDTNIVPGLEASDVYNITQVVNDCVVQLDYSPSTDNAPLDGNDSGVISSALYLTPLDVAGTINKNTLIDSLNNYDQSDFACWVGQACVIFGSSGIERTLAIINEIEYIDDPESDALKLPQVSLSQPLVFTGACDSLCLLNVKATDLKLNLVNKLELVQYKYSKSLYENLIKNASFFQNTFRKWVYDGATAPIIAPRGIYEHTFNLESFTYLCAIIINSGDSLLSDVTGLDSYRILVDGIATVSRKIVFSQRSSMAMERLLNGFDYLGDVVNTISINPNKNLMAVDYPYIIFQDIPVDGKPHKLVLSLTNGNVATDSTKNIRLFKIVFNKY